MSLWLFPIEPLEERYSADWYRWWVQELENSDLPFHVVNGKRLRQNISEGQFLDAIDTHYYKATQLASFVEKLHQGKVSSGDTVILLDAWNPAVTSLAYIRDASPVKFNITGCLHAGTWDPHDFLTQCGLGDWAGDVEKGWFHALDTIFVATKFHARLLTQAGCPLQKIRVTGFPLYCSELEREYNLPKSRKVVFPHRLAPEKNPEAFDAIQALYSKTYPNYKVEWVRTMDKFTSKSDYYRTLSSSRVAVSTAFQETWGIAMIEAQALGCVPVAPNRLSYPETCPLEWLYGDIGSAVRLIHRALNVSTYVYSDKFKTKWEGAIRSILDVIYRKG